MYLEESSLPGWTPTSDSSRWHGCYSYAFRTRDSSGFVAEPSVSTLPWPALRLADGNYVYAFDHCTSLSTVIGRYTCHKSGYNCVFYDGHVEFISGKMAERVDYIATFALTRYDANFLSCRYVFDMVQGIFY
jgi:prepilin-type processing-associated H-X9-DG protein